MRDGLARRGRARARTCFHPLTFFPILRVDLEDRRIWGLGSCHRSALAPRVSNVARAEESRVVSRHVRRAEGLGGSAAGSARISQEPVVRAELHHRLRVTDGEYPMVMESCARSGQGAVRRRRISSPLRKPRGCREIRSFERAGGGFQTQRSRAKAISAHPGPGGVAGIKGDVRRLDEYAPGMLSAHRGQTPRKFWSMRTLAGGIMWSSVEQYGKWWSSSRPSVDSFRPAQFYLGRLWTTVNV